MATLFSHPLLDAADRLVVASGGEFFNASFPRPDRDADADPADRPPSRFLRPAGQSGPYGSNNWHHARITDLTGETRTVLTNGHDRPVRFTGNTFTDARIGIDPALRDPESDVFVAPAELSTTGFDPATFLGVAHFKGRLWYWERTGTRLWYGAYQAPGGDVLPFHIGGAAAIEGNVRQIAKLSRDGGAGPDDYLVVLLDDGNAVVYEGTDPDLADAFRLVGRFNIGKPLGREPLIEYGGDLLALTETGITPVSGILAGRNLGIVQKLSPLTTDAIRGAWQEAVAADRSRGRHWSAVVAPDGSRLVVQTPEHAPDDGLFDDFRKGAGRQFVLNLLRGAWTEFRGMDAEAWCAHGDDLYYLARGGFSVFRAEAETADLEALVLGAYSYMPSPGRFGVQQGREGRTKRIMGVLPTLENTDDREERVTWGADDGVPVVVSWGADDGVPVVVSWGGPKRSEVRVAPVFDFADDGSADWGLESELRWGRFRPVAGRNAARRRTGIGGHGHAVAVALRTDAPTKLYNLSVLYSVTGRI